MMVCYSLNHLMHQECCEFYNINFIIVMNNNILYFISVPAVNRAAAN